MSFEEYVERCYCGAELVLGWPNGSYPPFDR